MKTSTPNLKFNASTQVRADEIYGAQRDRLNISTDRMFALLMAVQWLAGILAATIVSPKTWAGSIPSVHIHVWSAIICGGLISGPAIVLALTQAGKPITRLTIAVTQMLWSALAIHLTGGRIETHFHVFGSLAFVAIYRNWRLLAIATVTITIDHALRGIFWPQSVYGVLTASPLRSLEHAAWVIFEVIVLTRSCRQSTAEMHELAHQQATLEATNEQIEQTVQQRTEQLHQSLAWKAVVLETAADGIITFDRNGAILEFNHAAEEMFGYGRTEVVGLNVSTLMPSPYFESHAILESYDRTSETNVIDAHREVVGLKQDGSRFPVEVSVSVTDRDGDLTFTGFARDLTTHHETQTEIARINQDLRDASRRAGMAEVATGVLHNVGNVLNSVNVSASLMVDRLDASRVSGLEKAVQMLNEQGENVGQFLSQDTKGRQLPNYLTQVAKHIANDQDCIASELKSLTENINHIKAIVSAQQSFAAERGVMENTSVNMLLEDALRFSSATLRRHEIEIREEFSQVPDIETDKQRVIEILVNLIRNGKQAISANQNTSGVITLRTEMCDDFLKIHVIDDGVGIDSANLGSIFRHGFTTKKDGHGFGLHHSALAAKELGGSLSVHSDGISKGATFTLSLPLAQNEAIVL